MASNLIHIGMQLNKTDTFNLLSSNTHNENKVVLITCRKSIFLNHLWLKLDEKQKYIIFVLLEDLGLMMY